MKWTEAFKVVFAMVAAVGGASAIILILSSWLGKVWAQRILAREQAELHRLAKEHEIRFTELHLERAHVIKGLYEKLVDLYDSMHSLLNYFQGADEPSLDEKAQVFRGHTTSSSVLWPVTRSTLGRTPARSWIDSFSPLATRTSTKRRIQ